MELSAKFLSPQFRADEMAALEVRVANRYLITECPVRVYL